MKKYKITIFVFTIIIMSYLLVGCNGKKSEKLPQQYTPEMAQKNGDVVGLYSKTYNLEKLDSFMEKYKSQKLNSSESIRITTYTIEGDAIIHELVADNKSISLIVDNTRDKYMGTDGKNKKKYKVLDIYKQNSNQGITYIAKTDKGEEIPLLFIMNKVQAT